MKIAIAGYGIEGKASYDYWRERGDEVVVADERVELAGVPAGTETILGPDAFTRLGAFDRVIRSPSVRPDKLPYGDKVWSATNEFFARCPAPIIGVTGTKGKGTTSSLIASILRAAGRTVHLVGNIGQPALEVLPSIQETDIVVYELSSFQLWDLQKSPHVAVVLGIEPDHLDIHADMAEYIAAKSNIVAHQQPGDVVVYNRYSEYSEYSDVILNLIQNPVGNISKIPYPYDISEFASSLRIPGAHNVENASAAIAAVREYVTDPEIIRQGLASFTGLPHRLKFVAEKDGVKYYDDSIATTPGSAIAALKAFTQPKVIILGGSDKGADYTDIVELCRATNTQVIAVGQTGLVIRELCAKLGVVCVRVDGRMAEAVLKAHEIAHTGDVVILSPASASFDQYRSYADRGNQFIAAVEAL